MATLEEEMLAQRLGYPNFATLRQRERNARVREGEEAMREDGRRRREACVAQQRAGGLPGSHIFSTIGDPDDPAARAALAERRENYRPAAAAPGGNPGGQPEASALRATSSDFGRNRS